MCKYLPKVSTNNSLLGSFSMSISKLCKYRPKVSRVNNKQQCLGLFLVNVEIVGFGWKGVEKNPLVSFHSTYKPSTVVAKQNSYYCYSYCLCLGNPLLLWCHSYESHKKERYIKVAVVMLQPPKHRPSFPTWRPSRWMNPNFRTPTTLLQPPATGRLAGEQ